MEFVTEREREDFSRELSATEDWLYEEGEDQPKKVRQVAAISLLEWSWGLMLRCMLICGRCT